MHVKMLAGVPTPIRYLGLLVGNMSQHSEVISYISSVGSPTETPPMAYPSNSLEAIYSAECFRKFLKHFLALSGKEIDGCRRGFCFFPFAITTFQPTVG